MLLNPYTAERRDDKDCGGGDQVDVVYIDSVKIDNSLIMMRECLSQLTILKDQTV